MVNAFIEDTCVIIVLAYLLARGGILTIVFDPGRTRRQQLILGLVFGLIGLTEIIFPGARYPYVTSTLIVTFAALMVGLYPALLATSLIALGSLAFHGPKSIASTLIADTASALIGVAVARGLWQSRAPLRSLAGGICAQSAAVALLYRASTLTHTPYPLQHALISIPANGLGMLLLQLVVTDARIRADSERHRAEAERSKALMAEAQIHALRARIHPHFLFNALTSIAALCGFAPMKAEAAVLRLSELMRRSLEMNLSEPLRLQSEMDYVEGYLEIEQHRFGPRLHVRTSVDPRCACVPIPAYSVQTLVDNAVNHGAGPKPGRVTVCIIARASKRRAIIAVLDDGAGIDADARTLATAPGLREHGLQILTSQLVALYGSSARVRLLRREGGGTLAVFAVPFPPVVTANQESTDHEHTDCR